jgi:hypothetical protein
MKITGIVKKLIAPIIPKPVKKLPIYGFFEFIDV